MAVAPWIVSNELWSRIEPLLPKVERRFRYPGRKRLPDRQALQGILFVLCTGIAWRHLPPELGFGGGSTCHRRMDEWQRAGVWERLHRTRLRTRPRPLGRRAHLRLATPVQTAPRPLRPPSRDPRSVPRPRLLPRLLQEAAAVILRRVLSGKAGESGSAAIPTANQVIADTPIGATPGGATFGRS